jgi:hypothetical protein
VNSGPGPLCTPCWAAMHPFWAAMHPRPAMHPFLARYAPPWPAMHPQKMGVHGGPALCATAANLSRKTLRSTETQAEPYVNPRERLSLKGHNVIAVSSNIHFGETKSRQARATTKMKKRGHTKMKKQRKRSKRRAPAPAQACVQTFA